MGQRTSPLAHPKPKDPRNVNNALTKIATAQAAAGATCSKSRSSGRRRASRATQPARS
ncbi:hypothetical protein MXAN_3178 [Myxococcus xanthus DK 1622]|uniref:Uncharacterized protein n=1 Tax=Myxococcus xanthus (strain DK1622) TaxID=246197 RepID=Q1D7J2_MYXXD|nr:hypothetical protein MXAN_3178 [Myxococcus xanthus DK 1622]